MNNEYNNKKIIEVEFRDINENDNYQNTDINNVVKGQKLPFKVVVAVLEKKAKSLLNNKAKVIELVTRALSFCKKLGNISFLKKYFLDVPLLCDMLIDSINGVYKNLPYSTLVMVAIAILYTVTPFDILHDAIPIIGVLDDITVLKAVLNTIKNDLESYATWKQNQEAA